MGALLAAILMGSVLLDGNARIEGRPLAVGTEFGEYNFPLMEQRFSE